MLLAAVPEFFLTVLQVSGRSAKRSTYDFIAERRSHNVSVHDYDLVAHLIIGLRREYFPNKQLALNLLYLAILGRRHNRAKSTDGTLNVVLPSDGRE